MSPDLNAIVALTEGTLEGVSGNTAAHGAPQRLVDPADPAYAALADQAVVVLARGAEVPQPPPALLVVAPAQRCRPAGHNQFIALPTRATAQCCIPT